MAIAVRSLTVATTVDDVQSHFPGGWAAFVQAHPGAIRIGALARLNAPIAGMRCGVWTACKGAYVAELVPHEHIALVIGRHAKIGALVHRPMRLRVQPPRRPAIAQPVLEPTMPVPAPKEEPPLRIRSLPYGARPWYVGGDHDEARARRVAVWLHLAHDIPFDSLTVDHLALLPTDQFDVTATAVAWEIRTRVGGHASGTPNSVHGRLRSDLEQLDAILIRRGVRDAFGAHRFPAEKRVDAKAS